MMKMISCAFCGIVIDVSRFDEKELERRMYGEDYAVRLSFAGWDACLDRFVPMIACPSCHRKILFTNGEMA